MKRVFSMLLVIAMVIAMLPQIPLTAAAAEQQATEPVVVEPTEPVVAEPTEPATQETVADVPVKGQTESEVPQMSVEQSVTVAVPKRGYATVQYTARVSGQHYFPAEVDVDAAVYGYLYLENGEEIAEGFFPLNLTLEQGVTYLLDVELEGSAAGNVTLSVAEPVNLEYVTINDPDFTAHNGGNWSSWTTAENESARYYEYYWWDRNFTAYFSDGTTAEFNPISGNLYNPVSGLPYTISCQNEQSAENRWLPGNEYTVQILVNDEPYTTTVSIGAIEELSINQVHTAEVESSGQIIWFSYVPDITASYIFTSIYASGVNTRDTYGYLCDGNLNQLDYNDDGGSNAQFKITRTLTAGETYYFGVRYYSSSYSGSIPFSLSRNTAIQSASFEPVTLEPYAYGYTSSGEQSDFYWYDFSQWNQLLRYTVSLTDGTSVEVTGNGLVVGGTTYNLTLAADMQYEEAWQPGETYQVSVILNDVEYPVTVTIGDLETLPLDQDVTVNITEAGQVVKYLFTPEHSANYRFTSVSDYDTQAALYNGAGGFMVSNDDAEGDQDFSLGHYMEAGQTYVLNVCFGSQSEGMTGSFVIRAEAQAYITDIAFEEITLEYNTSGEMYYISSGYNGYYRYFWWNYLSYRVTMSDGRELSFTGTTFNIDGIDYALTTEDDQAYSTPWVAGNTYTGTATVGGVSYSVSVAITDYPEIQLDVPYTVSLDSTKHYQYLRFVPEVTGIYTFTSHASVDTYGYVYDANMNRLEYNDDSGEGANFLIKRELEAGQTYYLAARFYSTGREGSFDVTLAKQLGITSIEVDPLSLPVGTNGGFAAMSSGSSTSASENYFRYYWWNDLSYTVTFENGDTYSGSGTSFYYNNNNYSLSYTDEQSFSNPWTMGNTYTVELTSTGVSTQVQVSIVPLTNVEVNVHHNVTVTEMADGYFSNIYNETTGTYEQVFIYDWWNDVQVEMQYADYTNQYYGYAYYNGEHAPMFYNSQSQNAQPWQANNTYTEEVIIFGQTYTINVTVEPSPISSIEVDPVSIVENTSGYWSEYYDGSQYVDYYYYRWYYALTYTVYLRDGTSFEGSGNGFSYDGTYYSLSTSATQNSSNRWTAGNTYSAEVKLLGVTYPVSITITESPIDSISFQPVYMIENTDGSYSGGYSGSSEYYRYYWWNKLNWTLQMKDGSTVQGVGRDVTFEGFSYYVDYSDSQSSSSPWTVGNSYEVSVYWQNTQVPITVHIVENPVSDFQFNSISLEYNSDGYEKADTSSGNGYWHYNWIEKLSYQVTCNDGTVLECTGPSFQVGDITFNFTHYDSQSYYNKWNAGGNYQGRVEFAGSSYTVDIQISDPPIESLGLPIIVPNQTYTVDITEPGQMVYFAYSPETTGEYMFRSYRLTSSGYDTYGHLYNSGYGQLTSNDDGAGNLQFLVRYTLEAGKVYIFGARMLGSSNTGSFEVKLLMPEKVTAITAEPIALQAGTCGSFAGMDSGSASVNGETYYRYNWWNHLNYTVTFESGEQVSVSGNTSFTHNDISYSITAEDTQANQHWIEGREYTGNLRIQEVSCPVSVIIEASPVERIELNPLNLVPESGGYYTSQWDSELQQYRDMYYYYWWNRLSGTVYFKDGNQASFSGSSFWYDGYRYDVARSDNQYQEYWQIGGSYTVNVYIAGIAYELAVTITDPVESITVEPLYLVEGTGGTNSYGSGNYVDYYYYYWWDYLRYTVHFKDGTSQSYTGSGANYNGQYAGMKKTDSQSSEAWQLGNTYDCSFRLFGYEAQAQVTIISDISGELGDITWSLSEGGVLQLLGRGDVEWDDNYAPWSSYRSSITEIVVGDGITSIPNYMFDSYNNLQTVTLADSVTRVGYHAFAYCGNLRQLNCSDNLTYIGGYAFYDCVNLTELDLGSSLEEISNYAFYYCTNLIRVKFPATLQKIKYSAFGSCYDMQYVEYAGTQDAWQLLDIEYNNGYLQGAQVTCTGTATEVASGQADGISWVLNSDGVLVITGTGAMPDYEEGTPWAEYTEQIRKVVIEEGITSVGAYAFDGCTALKILELPATLTVIGQQAFMNCQSLSDVALEAVEEIGAYAFADCSALDSIAVTTSLKEIGAYAFDGCQELDRIYYNAPGSQWGQIEIAEGNEVLENVYMETVEAEGIYKSGVCGENLIWTVTNDSILTISGTGEMYDYDYRYPRWKDYYTTKLVVEEGVTTIGNQAFLGYDGISSIELPSTLTAIGNEAFYNLYYLESITLPKSLKTIGDAAFGHCESLSQVTLPNGLEEIGTYAFRDCYWLEEILIPATTVKLGTAVFQGCENLLRIRVNSDNPVYCDINGVLFTKDQKTLVAAPSGIHGKYTIPDGVEAIMPYAFRYCYSLEEVVIPDSVKTIGESAFRGCRRLEKVTLGNGIEEIPYMAFANTAIGSITIPASVKVIGGAAFASCSNLGEASIPEGVLEIGDQAFADCWGLYSASLPASLTYLGVGAFENCGRLQSITLPNNITEIGAYAFARCENLTEVILPESVDSVGEYAFWGCINLQKVELPDTVTDIGISAFEGCVNLTEAKIPEGVTEFVYRMFAGCENLQDIQIPTTVVTIGEQTFAGCESLTDVTIPDNVKNLGDRVFAECENLQTITLGKGVENVSFSMFNSCASLTAINVHAKNANLSSDNGVLYSKDKTILLRCPMGFQGEYDILDGVEAIQMNAFSGCDQITAITVPDSVRFLGSNCFMECTSLQEIDLSGTEIEEIPEVAFAGCRSMASVRLPETLKEIYSSAFEGCTSLTSVVIPEGVTHMSYYAFSWCSELQEIYLPESLVSIEEGAFYCCNSLQNVYFAGTSGLWENMYISKWGNENLFYANVTFEKTAQVTGLTISTLPEKVEYLKGEALDLMGMRVELTMSDGTSTPVDWNEVTGYDYNTVGEQTITVTYEGLSASFTVTVLERPVSIEAQPADRTAPAGSRVYFLVEASNVATYQWQYRRNATSSWLNTGMTGCKTQQLTVDVTTARNGYQYRCKLVGLDGNTYYTEGATLNLGDRIFEELVIHSAPDNTSFFYALEAPDFTGLVVYACYSDGTFEDVTNSCTMEQVNYYEPGLYPVNVMFEDKVATFSVLAVEDTTTVLRIETMPTKLDYLLGEELDLAGLVVKAELASGNVQDVNSFTINGYDPNTVGEQVVTIRANGCSTSFVVIVNNHPATILRQPESADAMETEKVAFTVVAENATAYQWQYCRSGSTKWYNTTMEGYRTDTLLVEATTGRNGYSYRCLVTGTDGQQVASEAATLTVDKISAITGIEITQLPDKLAYLLGRELDTEGLEITVTYADGKVRQRSEGLEITGYEPNVRGEQTITVTYEGCTDTFTVRVIGYQLETGVGYKLYMNQYKAGATLYFNGTTESDSVYYRLGVTTDVDAAVDVYLEEAEGGFHLYYMDGDTKTYIRVYERTDGPAGEGKGSLERVYSAPSEVLTYNGTYNTLVYTADDGENTYYMGTYRDYTTFSVSNISYLTEDNVGFSQFPAMLALEDEETPMFVAPTLPEEDGLEISIADALYVGQYMYSNNYTDCKYKITGTVDELVNDVFGNMYIVDANGDRLLVYGTYNEDGTVAYRNMGVPPVVGDTVTLYGVIGMYDEVEMKHGWIVAHSGAVRVTQQPESVYAQVGDAVSFTVGAAFAKSYRWQNSKDGGVTWYNTSMSGYNTDTLSTTATMARNGYQVRCKITGMDGTVVYSEPAVLNAIEEAFVTGIEITQLPKTEYRPGQRLDTTGLNVAASLSNGEVIDMGNLVAITGYEAYALGEHTLTVHFAGFTDTFTVTVADVNEIIQQPVAVNADSGDEVIFSVLTEGTVVSYQWQYRSIYKWYNTTMEGYNTNTLTVPAAGSRHGYDYRCEITFANGTVLYTEPAELTVNTVITIEKHPNDQVVALNAKGQFSAEATGESLKYQWQYCRPGSTLWLDTSMEGCTQATVYVETTKARDGYQYRCKITDVAGCVVYTEAATMTVLSVSGQPQDAYAPVNGTVTFTVTASAEEGFTYQWQYRRSATGTWNNTTMTGYNTDTLTVGATKARNGYQYRCVLTGAKNSKVQSDAATLYVSDPVVISAQPQNKTCAAGATATFSVTATNVKSYQWQYQRPSGTVWSDTSATGNTTKTVSIAAKASNNGYKYRCVITGMDGQIYYSDVATLTVG